MSSFSVWHWLIVGGVIWVAVRVLSGGVRLFSGGSRQVAPSGRPEATRYNVNVVGESYYRDALESILGPAAGTTEEVYMPASVELDDANVHDHQAVRIMIGGKKVGHLSRDDARRLRSTYAGPIAGGLRAWNVPARIYGGGDEELYSVSLALKWM